MYVHGQESLATGGIGIGVYEHDYTQGDFAYPDGRKIVEVGPKETVLVRMSDIHELPQIRETINEDEIIELAHAIIKDNEALAQAETPEQISAALDLMHPPELNLLDPPHLEQYLQIHADFYELDAPIVIPHHNRPVLLRDTGHRRGRAMEYIIVKMKGLTLDDVGIRSVVYRNLSFTEANARQAKENSHVRTSPLEDAKNIRRQYNFMLRQTGQRPRVTEIAKLYGFKEDKVRTALAFTSLPDSIKAFAGETKDTEVLSYTLLADFAPLRDLYEQRYDRRFK